MSEAESSGEMSILKSSQVKKKKNSRVLEEYVRLTLFSHLLILLPSIVSSPGLLNNSGECVELSFSHLLEKKQLKETEKKQHVERSISLVFNRFRGLNNYSVLYVCVYLFITLKNEVLLTHQSVTHYIKTY